MSDIEIQLNSSLAALLEYFHKKQDRFENPAQLVVFAEHAIKNGFSSIAMESLQMYYSLDPPENQFFIRAHLCEALVLSSAEKGTQVKPTKALNSILKAVGLALKSKCYHFLVVNASVLMWHICRPFQRPGLRKYFAKHLQVMVKALGQCDKQDYAWSAELLMGLVLCHLDAGHKEDAEKVCISAVYLVKNHVPEKLDALIRLQVGYNLGSIKSLEKDIRHSAELCYIFMMSELKYGVLQEDLQGPELERKIRKLLRLATKDDPVANKTYALRDSFSPTGLGKPPIFLELASFSLENSLVELAQECVSEVPQEAVRDDPLLLLQWEILRTQLLVACSSRSNGGMYSLEAVEARVQGVRRLEEVLTSALKRDNSDLVEHVCVILWNMSLPLLQHNLRHHLAQPLTTLVTALERIESLLYELRVTTYLELAKTCAQLNHLQPALNHLAKATALDMDGKYWMQLQHYTLRFSLRAQIYSEPDSDFDKAAKIIEQSGSLIEDDMRNKLGPLLIKAGQLLAPNHFTLAMEGSPNGITSNQSNCKQSLSNPKDFDMTSKTVPLESLDPELADSLSQKANKLEKYKIISLHAQCHAARYLEGDEMEKRCRLWGDLAKIARKNGVWEVALIAATFCLQYDANVTTNGRPQSTNSMAITDALTSAQFCVKKSRKMSSVRDIASTISHIHVREFQTQGTPDSHVYSKLELIRMMSDMYCLLAECLVYQLKQEGLELGQDPCSSLVKVADSTDSQDVGCTEAWLNYSKWCTTLTEDAHKYFLKAASLGVSLDEPHRISNAIIYLWNYNQKLINTNATPVLVPTFRSLLAIVRSISCNIEGELVARVCIVLGRGIIKKWTSVQWNQLTIANDRKTNKKEVHPSKKRRGSMLGVDPDSIPELKEAVEACDYAMSMSAGVTMWTKRKLLAIRVQAYHLLQQPIPPKTFGIEEINDGCMQQCRVLVAMEMVSRQGNKMWEFPNCPTVSELFAMLSNCEWTIPLLEMEMWTRLAKLALEHKFYELVCQCVAKAKQLQGCATVVMSSCDKHLSAHKASSLLKLENMLLSHITSFFGQSLVATASGGRTRQALDAFLESARFGDSAGSYDLVLVACTHFWNASLCLCDGPLERQLLKEPLIELIDMISTLQPSLAAPLPGNTSKSDHRLMLAMFGVVFQSYIDQSAWEDGLEAVEKAVLKIPKTFYLNLIRYRVIFKSRLGFDIASEMIRFKDEPEMKVASLWHEVAAHSTDPTKKLKNYQNAIQTLKSECNSWFKVECLMELSEWLYQQHFPLQDCLDQLDLVVCLLLGLANTQKPHSAKQGQSAVVNEGSVTMLPSPSSAQAFTVTHFPLASSSSSSIVQLEAMLRMHMMMLQLQGADSQAHWELSIAATAYCSLIWKAIYTSFNKFSPALHLPGPAQHLPSSLKDWAEFQLPEQILNYMSGTGTEDDVTLRESIHKPMLTLHYLEVLVSSLTSLGLHPLAFPVLNLEMAIVQTTLSSNHHFCKLIHMQISQVCLNMGLLSEAAVHTDRVGHTILAAQDIAKSHVEMQTYQAKKEAVAKEATKWSLHNRKSSKTVTFSVTRDSCATELPHVKEEVLHVDPVTMADGIVLRALWVKQARLLIQQGRYTIARELLNQARMECQCFDDQHTYFQVHISSGLLASAEKNTTQAILYFTEALKQPCLCNDLFEGVLFLSEAVLENTEYSDQYCSVLEQALNLIEEAKQRHRNESFTIDRITHILKSRIALYSMWILDDKKSSPCDLAKAKTQQHCMTINDSVKMLLELGHIREASTLLRQLGSVCKRLGQRVSGTEHKQYILQALDSYQKAMKISQTLCLKVNSFCQHMEDTHVLLPVELELVECQLAVADILLFIFSNYSMENRNSKIVEQQKSCIQKMIDDYVHETPVLPFVEEEWVSTAQLSCDVILNLLTSAHSMSRDNSKLKAKCTALLGHCFRLISSETSSDPPGHWEEIPPVIVTDLLQDKQDGTAAGDKGIFFPTTCSPCSDDATEQTAEVEEVGDIYSKVPMIIKMKEARDSELMEFMSLKSLALASHSLIEAVNLAMANKHWEVGMEAALGVVECVGGLDPSVSSLYLTLYQSLAFSREMCRFLHKLQPDPHFSQLASLICQRDRLITHTSSDKSKPLTTNSCLLNSYEAFKTLSVDLHHLDYLKSCPAYFRFLVLQHSPDMSKLYAALLIPTHPPSSSAQKRGQPPPISSVHPDPVITAVKVSERDLKRIESMMSEYRMSVYQTLTSPCDCEKLTNVCMALSEYLSDALQSINVAMSNEKTTYKELYVVLLADTRLLALPLESLPLLKQQSICSVTRDFSLQMLQHRMSKNASEETDTRVLSTKDKKKFQVQPPLIANLSNFKYILDPCNCLLDTTKTPKSPALDILALIRSFSQLTGKWTGFIPSTNCAMSTREWPCIMKDATGLVYFGSERLLTTLQPELLVSMNLPDCSLAVIIDCMSSPQSIFQQSSVDLHKSEEDLYFEGPLQMAALLSLTGVGCIVGSQWYTSVSHNLELTSTLIKELLSDSKTVGKVHWQAKSTGNQNSSNEVAKNSRSFPSLLYNSVVYGVPHLILVPAS